MMMMMMMVDGSKNRREGGDGKRFRNAVAVVSAVLVGGLVVPPIRTVYRVTEHYPRKAEHSFPSGSRFERRP